MFFYFYFSLKSHQNYSFANYVVKAAMYGVVKAIKLHCKSYRITL